MSDLSLDSGYGTGGYGGGCGSVHVADHTPVVHDGASVSHVATTGLNDGFGAGCGTTGIGATNGLGAPADCAHPCGTTTTLHNVPLKVQVSVGHPNTVAHHTTGYNACGGGCGGGCGGSYGGGCGGGCGKKKDVVPAEEKQEDDDSH